MERSTFHCIDAHTCGNPVRLVKDGVPKLEGNSMMEKRRHFLQEFDWIRKGLMFEPRGHDMMSGSMLFAPHDSDNDVAVLFVETSGCLPMCGHGLIGTVTIALEEQLVVPKRKGELRVETPAGLVCVTYKQQGRKVTSVHLTNVPSFLYATEIEVVCPDLGVLIVDVAYGGNFYAIIDPQPHFKGIEHYSSLDLIRWSRALRERLNEAHTFVHPQDEQIQGLSHIMWTGTPLHSDSTARNAVFYGEKAIDRSPCGTGTSARMAQWHAKGKLQEGEMFIHESIIGSRFLGKIEGVTTIGKFPAIIPGIEGWARITGYNQIFLDSEDPFIEGFTVL